MDVISIILSLVLLMTFDYRGFSVIVVAPIFALCAAVLSGLPIMPSYTELFMGKAVVYIKSFFPVFLLGAIFGKVMEDTGLAKSIAKWLILGLGAERAILSIVLAASILTYGGVSLFVVVFAVYPFAAALFKEGNLPKHFIPASIALGAFAPTMDAIPGTPQIQNLIPTNFFGTNAYAAPIAGILGSLIIYGVGLWYLNHRLQKAVAKGEGYGNHTLNEPVISEGEYLPPWYLAVVPLAAVLIVNFGITEYVKWDPSLLETFKASGKTPLVAAGIKNVASIWSLIIALVIGIVLAMIIGRRALNTVPKFTKTLNAGAIGSLLAIMNTASEVGYGNVIASLDGFKHISSALLSIQFGGNPLMSEAVSVTTLAGITGSASGGLSIALDLMSQQWLAWANQIGMSPEILHRVASMASGGMDTLPHNGAVITLLAVCGLTHKESYKDIFAITCIKTLTVFVIILFYTMTGIY